MADNKPTGYWKVLNAYTTPESNGATVHARGTVVSTNKLGAPEHLKPAEFARELEVLGIIVEVPAPETAKPAAPAAEAVAEVKK